MPKDQWEKVEAPDTWDFESKPEMIGQFEGVEPDVGPNHSNLYSFKVNGEVIGVWGSAILDSRFKNLIKGEDVRVVFTGKKLNPKTNRSYKEFEVYHKKGNVSAPKLDGAVKDEEIPLIEEE